MLNIIHTVLEPLTAEGGLLRVRALLALGMTGIGGFYLIDNLTMPPTEFSLMWVAAQAWYFGTRGGK